MKKIIYVLLVVVCSFHSMVKGNYLVNGDAEIGDFSGWDFSGANLLENVATRKQKTCWVQPAEGDRFFSFARIQGSFAIMNQTGIIDPGLETLTFGGVFQGEYSDYGTAVLSIYDQAGGLLLSESTGDMTTPILVWETFEVETILPQGAYSWEVMLEGTLDYGSYVNVFYDGLYLIPEPATALLLGLGGLGLVKRRRLI